MVHVGRLKYRIKGQTHQMTKQGANNKQKIMVSKQKIGYGSVLCKREPRIFKVHLEEILCCELLKVSLT